MQVYDFSTQSSPALLPCCVGRQTHLMKLFPPVLGSLLFSKELNLFLPQHLELCRYPANIN